jgi:hypothetical protein
MIQQFTNDDELHQQITALAQTFKIFQCEPCALTIQEFLIRQGKSGKLIKLYTGNELGKYGNIYHEKLNKNIATNGHHQAIAVIINQTELIFDNLHPEGINRQQWLNNFYCIAMDLGSGFQITEIEF